LVHFLSNGHPGVVRINSEYKTPEFSRHTLNVIAFGAAQIKHGSWGFGNDVADYGPSIRAATLSARNEFAINRYGMVWLVLSDQPANHQLMQGTKKAA
jgi:hypothetical protein